MLTTVALLVPSMIPMLNRKTRSIQTTHKMVVSLKFHKYYASVLTLPAVAIELSDRYRGVRSHSSARPVSRSQSRGMPIAGPSHSSIPVAGPSRNVPIAGPSRGRPVAGLSRDGLHPEVGDEYDNYDTALARAMAQSRYEYYRD